MQRFDLIRNGVLIGFGAIGLMALSATASVAAPLGKYTFEDEGGAFTANGNAASIATGIGLSAFTNGPGVTPQTSNTTPGNPGLAYQTNGWTRSNGPALTQDFLTFTVQPINNVRFTIAQILFDSKRGAGTGSSGPRLWALRSSIDNFVNNLDAGSLGATSNWQPIVASLVGMPYQTGPVIFRLYGYDSNNTTLTDNVWAVDNVSIDGTVTPTTGAAVPTPAAIPAIVGFGISLWRKRRGLTANR
jgi:hypothetical protein